MKLVRFGAPGKERPGLIDPQGRVRDLSELQSDLTAESLSAELLARLSAIPVDRLPLAPAGSRLGPPIAGIRKFIAIGLNYCDHAKEAGMAVPTEPVIFMKATSCITGPNDPIVLPRESRKTDWEVELGIVIGTQARYVSEADALEHVVGYLAMNDVSERAFQLERGGQWDKGKGCDTFGPIGPWLVTRDEIPDPQNLDLRLVVNGQEMQRGNTRTMIFPCTYLVSYVSRFMTLLPGDLIATGTPPGVGLGRKPPLFLKAGDRVDLSISGLGEQHQEVRASL